jgi:hypothetical protein
MTDSKARLIALLSTIAATALALATLLPTWVPRSGLGWEHEHLSSTSPLHLSYPLHHAGPTLSPLPSRFLLESWRLVRV